MDYICSECGLLYKDWQQGDICPCQDDGHFKKGVIMKKLISILVVFSSISFADFGGIQTDKAAHFGMSFALNAAGYGVCKAITKINREEKDRLYYPNPFAAGQYIPSDNEHKTFCRVFGATAAIMAGLMKEAMDRTNGASLADTEGDLIADGLGVATFTLFTFAFDF